MDYTIELLEQFMIDMRRHINEFNSGDSASLSRLIGFIGCFSTIIESVGNSFAIVLSTKKIIERMMEIFNLCLDNINNSTIFEHGIYSFFFKKLI